MAEIITAEPTEQPAFAWQATKAAFGFGTPREQLLGSFAASIVAYVTTAISLGATVGLVLLFGVLFLVGLVRLAYQEVAG